MVIKVSLCVFNCFVMPVSANGHGISCGFTKFLVIINVNDRRTFASSVVFGEKVSFMTETLIASLCVDTDVITSSIVIKTLVSI